MKYLLILSFSFATFLGFSQKIKFKIQDQKDTTIFLVKYYGKGMYYADTAVMKNGTVEFDGSKQLAGVMALLLPGQKMFDFLYNKEDVSIEVKNPELVKSMVVKKSEENKLFSDYVKLITSKRTEVGELVKERESKEKDSEDFKKVTKQIEDLNKSVLTYQRDLVKNHPDKLVGKVVKMSLDIEIPEAPRDMEGKLIDSNFSYHYYRDHYFDNIDIRDDRMLSTPMFHNKLDEYFGKKMMIQHPDTIVKYGYIFLDKLDQKSDMFKYCLTHITSTAEKSKIMGMDKVFVRMGERYYCAKNTEGKPVAYWMPEDKLKELCDKVEVNKVLVQGVVPPNVILRDSTDVTWKDYYSIKAEYTVLYFWDPECGHCKTTTPKLQQLYAEKLKARNVEVFAVGKAIGEDFDKWKAFIKKNNLTFTNVALTDKLYKAAQEDARQFVPKYTTIQSLNYQETFDIFSTPKVFILDKDKKIVAKQLSISQVEDFLDRMQGVDAPKLIEPDPEDTNH
jgi:thiol-disulfide isomerase/thioredoxin